MIKLPSRSDWSRIGPDFRHMLLATLFFGAASGIFMSTLNNYLSDVHALDASARGWLEFPRELPGFLIIGVSALLLSFIWSLVFFAAIMVFPGRIVSMFGDDAEFLRMGVQALRIFALGVPFIGIQIVIASFFQGIGKGLPSVVLASARHGLFLLPALAILPGVYGLTGLWASFAASSFMAAVLAVVWAGHQFRTMGVPLRFRSPAA